jgi:hypothetical protein
MSKPKSSTVTQQVTDLAAPMTAFVDLVGVNPVQGSQSSNNSAAFRQAGTPQAFLFPAAPWV